MKPQRVVCLTAETTELAFAVGAGERVVGVSGYAVRPAEARKKPHVAAFRTAHVERILALRPDLVLGFSDLQADIAAELIRRGANVFITNQRTLTQTWSAMRLIASVLGEAEAGESVIVAVEDELAAIACEAAALVSRPRVYFEEWDEPMIAGIAWASELIELCGGKDIFADHRGGVASDRIVQSAEVVSGAPDVIFASWCGKKARLEKIAARSGWADVPAVHNGALYEIKAPDILQPGLSLVHGARQMATILRAATP